MGMEKWLEMIGESVKGSGKATGVPDKSAKKVSDTNSQRSPAEYFSGKKFDKTTDKVVKDAEEGK